jgi:hypothetical protein
LSSVDSFLDDLKLQAQRDLAGAEIIAKGGGPIEHEAWLCEQSFEKIVKYVYAYFKLKIQAGNLNSVHDKMREQAHYGTPILVINMLRELYRAYGQTMMEFTLKFAKIPDNLQLPIRELLDKLPKNYVGYLDKVFDGARDRMAKLLGDKLGLEDALKKSVPEHLHWYLQKFDNDERIEDIVKNEAKAFQGLVDISQFTDPTLYQKNFNFPLKALAISPWILPYTETSRYPLKEYNYSNLQLFRKYEGNLRPYFASLIEVLRELQKEADDYIESLNTFKKAVGGSA